eukprot:m.196285 g.196285  ORF g.196285 m.196285 type:complete len:1165 (+) comp17011_c0_seq2:122-3616(+)
MNQKLFAPALLFVLLTTANSVRIGIPADVQDRLQLFDWWADWSQTNVTLMRLNGSRDGFDLLEEDALDMFLAVGLDSLCFGGYDLAVQSLAIAFTEDEVQWNVKTDENEHLIIDLPDTVFQDASSLLLARLQIAIELGIDLAQEKVVVTSSWPNITGSYTSSNTTFPSIHIPIAVWHAAQHIPSELRTELATAISNHDGTLQKPLEWTHELGALYYTRLALHETLALSSEQYCGASEAKALSCPEHAVTSGECSTCPSDAIHCLCSLCVDPSLPQVHFVGTKRDNVYQRTSNQICVHQQTCVSMATGETVLLAISTPQATVLDFLTASSYHNESLVQLDRVSSNITLLQYTPDSEGLHVLQLLFLDETMDLGISVKPWQCQPTLHSDCPCPIGTFSHADECYSFGEVAKVVVVPIVIIVISLGLMLAPNKALANQAWSIRPAELKFTNPPEILGAGSFGVVIKGMFRGTPVAVKQALPDRKGANMLGGSSAFDTLSPNPRQSLGRVRSIKQRPAAFSSKPSATSLSSMQSGCSDATGPEQQAKPVTRKHSQASRGYLEQVRRQLTESTGQSSVNDTTARRKLRRVRTRPRGQSTIVTIQEEEMEESQSIKTTFLDQMKQNAGYGSRASLGMVSIRASRRFRSLTTAQTSQSTRMRLLKEELLEEMAVLCRLRHPNITTIIGCCVEKGVLPLLVLEYLELGSLYDLLHNSTIDVDGDVSIPILRDIASGLAYLHGSQPPIIHADMKSANVLVDANFKAKLTDFGLSSRRHLGAVGTPFWMAPELLLNETPTPSSDMYAFGVVLFEVLTASVPYAGEEVAEVLPKVMLRSEPPKRPKLPTGIVPPGPLVELMEACWDNNPLKRPVASAVLDKIKSLDATESYILKKKQESKLQQRVLNDVFPEHIAKALSEGRKVEPEKKPAVTIFFSDIVGFTNISSSLSPIKVSQMLDRLYRAFDELSYTHNVYKVETIGDAFMGATNLVRDQADHTVRMGRFALAAIEAAHSTLIDDEDPSLGYINIRVGIHCGPVVASVVGSRNPRYCLFGDTVNTASRMESNSEKNKVQLSTHAAVAMKKQGYDDMKLIKRGQIPIKGKGLMTTYWLVRRKIGDRKASALSSVSLHSSDSHQLNEEDATGLTPLPAGPLQTASCSETVLTIDQPLFETADI